MGKKPTYEELEQRVKELENETFDHNQAEEVLRESEKKYKHLCNELEAILDHLPALIFYKDKKGNFIRVNKYVADAHHMQKKELESKSTFDLYPEDQAQTYLEDDLKVIESSEPKLFIEEPWETEKGKRWVSTSKIPFIDEQGDILGIIGISIDTTERKQTEEVLRESEERYRSLIETITDIVFIISPNGNLTYLNPEFEKLTGYPVQDVIGHAFTEILAPEYIESTVDRFTRGLSGETIPIYEVELKQKDGKTAPVELKVTSLLDDDGKTIGRIGLARDISERKRAEEALRKSESSLSRAQTIAHLGNWEYDSLTGKITWSGEAYRIFGFTPQELDVTTDLIRSMIHPEDRNRVETALQDVQGVFGQQDLEYRIIRRDGTVRHVHSQRDVSIAEEVPVRIFGTLQDITARKQAEETLRESEEKYRSLFEESRDAIVLTTQQGKIIDANPAALELFGYIKEEILKMNFQKLYVEPDEGKGFSPRL